jgi:pyruvate carboxylase
METVPAYPFEDRHSIHRSKASESYKIRGGVRPVQACLDVQQIVTDRAPRGPIECVAGVEGDGREHAVG